MGRTIYNFLTILALAPRLHSLKTGREAFLAPAPCQQPISFHEFVQKYERRYDNEEYQHRAGLYTKRAEEVAAHNCRRESSWHASINNLADWTEEALDGLLGANASGVVHAPASDAVEGTKLLVEGAEAKIRTWPTAVSWGHLPAIRNQRHQGHCGSCWAVTALTVFHAFLDIRNKTQDLSLSQVVACTPNPRRCGGTGGCHGATSGLAFNYILHAGLVNAREFPYPYASPDFRDKEALHCPGRLKVDAADTQKTMSDFTLHEGSQVHWYSRGSGHRMGMTGWRRLPVNKEAALVRALVEHGPVAVSVAPSRDWHIYGGGVFPAGNCDRGRVLKHAVVLYGYGRDDALGMRFWRIKNSWGGDWGEGGSMRLERLDDEEADCGWDESPEKGSECAGGRDRVWVCGSCGIVHEATVPVFD